MEEKSLQSTSPLGAIDVMGTITTIHLVLIALFAVAAVLVIVWGAKRRRAKQAALTELEAEGRLQAVDADPPAETVAEPTPPEPQPVERIVEPEASFPAVVAPVSEPIPQPVPVAPPPPPIVETPVEIVTPPVAASQPSTDSGDLTRLKGLGPKVAARLAELNVTRIADLATLDDAQAAALDAQLGNFKGRMDRDKWIEQARLLNADDIAGYEAQFGKLG